MKKNDEYFFLNQNELRIKEKLLCTLIIFFVFSISFSKTFRFSSPYLLIDDNRVSKISLVISSDRQEEVAVQQKDTLGIDNQSHQEDTMTAADSSKTEELNPVVVIAFGKSNQKNLTSSVSTIKAESIKEAPVTSVINSLAGRASGLIVTQSGGGMGNYASISIRGGAQPLVVINGIVSDYNEFIQINPDDIDTFSILKDAASTAMYGARAGDGVLVITTKSGKGETKINFNTSLMLTTPSFTWDKLSSYEKVVEENKLRAMYGLGARYPEDVVEKYRTGSDPYNYPNIDWLAVSLNKYAPQQTYNVSLSGGGEKNTYYLSMGIMDQGTIYKDPTTKQQRYNFNLGTSTQFDKVGLKIAPSISGYVLNSEAPLSATAGGLYNDWQIFSHIINRTPMELDYNKFGQIYSSPKSPLVEMSPDSGYDRENLTRIRTQIDFDWKLPWVNGLSFGAKFNFSPTFSSRKQWNKTANSYDLDGVKASEEPKSLNISKGQGQMTSVQYLANFENTFKEKHFVQLTGGYEASYGWGDNLSGSRSNYMLPIDQLNAGPSETQTNSASEWEEGRAGLVGRAKYEFNSKYQIEGNVRYDGSDYFPEDKRWGTFYSVSAGWTVSKEKFFEAVSSMGILNYLKFRGSYGETGKNSGIGRYAYLQSYNYNSQGYVLDDKFYPTFSEGGLPSPDISWFTQTTTDIGMDFETLRSRLRGSIDYFYMETTGFLSSPSNVGFTDPLGIDLPTVLSKGEQRREGFDFSLSWKDYIDKFSYEVGGNFTYFDQINSVNWSEAESSLKNPYTRSTQQSGYWGTGYRSLGFFQTPEDVMNSPRRLDSANLLSGDIRYEDSNGDGKIDSGDVRRIGKPGMPRANYGIYTNFGFKGFFLNILFQGATRRDIYMSGVAQNDTSASSGLYFVYEQHKDYWTPDNRDAMYPRPGGETLGNGGNNYTQSDFWLINGAYFRLKNLNFGYDLKAHLLKSSKFVKALKISLSGYNLFTFSDVTQWGLDPENSSSSGWGYPVTKTYAMGFNVSF